MWADFWRFVGPLMLGVVITMIFEGATGKAWGLVLRQAFKMRARRNLRRLRSTNDRIVRGDEVLYVVEFVPHGWKHENIVLHERAGTPTEDRLAKADQAQLPAPRRTLFESLATTRTLLESRTDGQWNGPSLAVEAIQPSRLVGREEPLLELTVSESDHASAVVCSNSWRAAFDSGKVDLPADSIDPIPGMLNAIGVNATVVTDDNHLVLVQRSPRTEGARAGWHISVNEGMLPTDRNSSHRLDPHVALVRGIAEELGIEDVVEPSMVHFHTAMFDVRRYQFGLLGHVDLKGTRVSASQLQLRRTLGGAQDKFENTAIHLIPWRPKPVLTVLAKPGWIAHGWLNLVQSALESFPRYRAEFEQLTGRLAGTAGARSTNT